MVSASSVPQHNENPKAIAISLIIHLLLVLLIFLKLGSVEIKETGGGGVVVALGYPDNGFSNDTPSPGKFESQPPQENTPTPVSPPPPSSTEQSKANTGKAEDLITSDDAESIFLKKKKENERKQKEDTDRKQKQFEEEQRQAEVQKKQQQLEAENAKKAAEAKQKADYDAKKNKYKDMLGGGGSGKGSGNSGKPGNGGDPNGDPNEKNIEGTPGKGGSGSGGGAGSGIGASTGGGLGGRPVRFKPPIVDNSQKSGKVRVKVCADAAGNVISANFTQAGSTSTDGYLVDKAVEAARKFKFAEGAEVQCGWIDFNFQVK